MNLKKTMSKYPIGTKVPRDEKTPLIIFAALEDGTYAARTMYPAIKRRNIVQDDPKPGDKVTFRNGRVVIFLKHEKAQTCSCAYDDRVILTEAEIDTALADQKAAEVFHEVATKRERGGNTPSNLLRFLPRNASGTT